MYLLFKPFPLTDEESGDSGASGPVDADNLSDEELDAQLSSYLPEGEEEAETPTPEEEATETEPDEESPTSESEEKEEESEEPAEDPAPTSEETEAEKLYAEKYKTPEELEQAYINSNSEAAKLARERAELLKEIEEIKAQGQKIFSPPQEEPTEKKDETDSEVNDAGLTQQEQDEYDRLYYDEAKGPAHANLYLNRVFREKESQATLQTETVRLEQEAVDHNKSLTASRAKELICEHLESSDSDALKELASKYKDENYVLTEEDIKGFPEAMKALDAEFALIEELFKPTSLTFAGQKVSSKGKWAKDVYQKAHLLLNHDKIVEKQVIKANEDTANAIKKGTPTAKVLTPSGKTKSGLRVEWSGDEDRDQATVKGDAMDDAALDEALEKF